MKRTGIFILTAAMLASLMPVRALAADQTGRMPRAEQVSQAAQTDQAGRAAALDLGEHVEVKGADPVYPKAPRGFKDYGDYKQSTGEIHDTEFYYDPADKTWYYYYTNSPSIYSSKNLVNWTKEETDRGGNAWAPCIIRLREPVEYEGETYTYALWDSLSTFGTRESWIRLWLSNSPKEGFVQAGNTVVSELDDGKPHNAIDPSVFYDKDGRMWMVFGSYFGGIFLFELDPATCMAMHPEELPGKRIAYRSAYGNSEEGPTILYNPNTDYYYLNVSYGSLDHTYNVRIGRSRNVEGPYYDYNGLPMDNTGYSNEQVKQIGTKITSPYYFEPDNGWYSTGHSAFLYNPNTDEYFLSHNARLETIHGAKLNIRKIYWTEDGWPVVSPEIYAEGEKEQKIPTRCIPGVYQVIPLLRDDLPTEPIASVKRGSQLIELKKDHSITGAYQGSWIQTGEHTLKLALGGTVYTVTVAAAWDWENWKPGLVFTGLSEAADTPGQGLTELYSGLGIWGKKADPEIVGSPVYRGSLLADFKMNGECRDASPYRRKATPGAGEYVYEDGIVGQALRNRTIGTNLEPLIRLEDNILHVGNSETFTIQAWIRPDALRDHATVLYSRGSGRWLAIMPCSNETHTPVIRVRDDLTDVWSDLSAPEALAVGEWALLSYVYDSGTTILYVNGREAARSDAILNPFNSSDQTFYIGGNPWDPGFEGLIDEMSFYGTAWTGDQLKTYYEKMTTAVRPVDPAELNRQIQEAEKLKKSVRISANGKDVGAGDVWVTAQDLEELEAILKQAKAAAGNAQIDQNLADAWAEEMKTAIQLFTEKMREGQRTKHVETIFGDVKAGEWFVEDAQYVYDNGIMTGLNATHFGPAADVSRAQFAVILWRMEGEPEAEYAPKFPDVPDAEKDPLCFFRDAVMWASSEGVEIITGYESGSRKGMFGPADAITREQLATMLYRYADYRGEDTSASADLGGFPDGGSVSDYARKAMSWAAGMEIVTGNEKDHTLAPQGSASRAQAAAMIRRFCKDSDPS